MKPHKRIRQQLSEGYDVRQSPDELTSDDSLGNSFDGRRVKLEVRIIKYGTYNSTKHQKTRSSLGPDMQRLHTSSSPHLPVYSSSSGHRDRVYSQSHAHEDEQSDSDEYPTGSTQYLWGKARRKGPTHSTSEHKPVVAATESYLKAWIISGRAGSESTPWPDANKQWLSNRMAEAWERMSILLGDRSGRKQPGVNAKPTEAEARKVTMNLCLQDILLITLVL